MEQGKQQYVSAFNVQIIIVVMATSFRSFVRHFLKNDIPHRFEMRIGVIENPSLPMRGLKENLNENAWFITIKYSALLDLPVQSIGAIRIRLSSSAMNKMNAERLYRSPIFVGGVSVGKESALTGGIEWDLY